MDEHAAVIVKGGGGRSRREDIEEVEVVEGVKEKLFSVVLSAHGFDVPGSHT